MSLTFKLLSLVIRTAAKPIGNYIKRQAREHDGFRRFAVAQAQRVHRIDMRMRLGLLHDAEAQQRMHAQEQRRAEEKRRKEEIPTVRNEAEQQKHDEQSSKETAGEVQKREDKPPKVKIRPLSEGRAIELGANFFSEAFIFAVAAGLLVWDSWRSRRKESARRDDVKERLEQLESEVESLRSTLDPDLETLHDLSERIKEAKRRRQSSWWNPVNWVRGPEDAAIMEEGHDVGKVEPVEEPERIVPVHKTKQKPEKSAEADQIPKATPKEATKEKKAEEKTPVAAVKEER